MSSAPRNSSQALMRIAVLLAIAGVFATVAAQAQDEEYKSIRRAEAQAAWARSGMPIYDFLGDAKSLMGKTVSVRGVAEWLGDTPTVARSSYIDPRVIIRYESDGQLTAIPRLAAVLPAAAEAEVAVAALLAADVSGPGAADGGRPGAVT